MRLYLFEFFTDHRHTRAKWAKLCKYRKIIKEKQRAMLFIYIGAASNESEEVYATTSSRILLSP